jgi:hypothetical protein
MGTTSPQFMIDDELYSRTEENYHQAAENNEKGTERSHLGSAACCIWAAPA